MKSPKTLMIFLIVSDLLLSRASADDLTNFQNSLKFQTLTDSVKIELPLPVTTERQKFIINSITKENVADGYICHNFFREKEIKDKLFSLQTKSDTIPELEKKVLETPAPTSLITSSTTRDIAIGAVLGLLSGFFVANKLK